MASSGAEMVAGILDAREKLIANGERPPFRVHMLPETANELRGHLNAYAAYAFSDTQPDINLRSSERWVCTLVGDTHVVELIEGES